ncbi:MAG: hypothetical protein IKO51_05325 [Clostridia bacterium]|nr:hypothetical protein [Clostridia bacterium]
MKTVTATPSLVLPLGRMGENEYTKIKFDVSGWLDELPAATIGLYNQRPQDADAYPVDGITVEDGIVTWTITSAELAQVGKGRCELVAIQNNVVAKSAIYNTIVFDALDGSCEAPDPWDSWQETFVALKAEAVQAAQDAETAVTHYPRIVDGYWQVWDVQTGAWVSTGVHAQGEKGDKGDDALCVYLENPTVAIPCDADGLTKQLNQIVAVGYAAFRGGERIAASSEYAGYTYANPKQMLPYEIYGFEINPATATSSGVIGFRITEGVNPFGVVEAEIANPTIGITVEGSAMNLPLQLVRVRDGETPELPVQDVQVNGSSVVTDGVANVPVATTSTGGLGVVQPFANSFVVDSAGQLRIAFAAYSHVKEGTNDYRPITPAKEHAAAFYGLAKAAGDTTQSASSNAVGTYTENAKSKISEMLNGSVAVTGTTPTITALSGIQYVCGEVSTLDITLPESGIVDVVFTSGSTPTVLTITPPTGMTVEWANGFDSTALEADTMYELNIKMVGTKCLGVAVGWT